jgi:hypothetical protein
MYHNDCNYNNDMLTQDSIQIPCPIRDLLIATISFNFKLHTHFGHPSAEYELSLQWCLSHNSALEGKTWNKSSNSTPSILHKYLLGSIVLLRSHSNFQWEKSLGVSLSCRKSSGRKRSVQPSFHTAGRKNHTQNNFTGR